MQVLSAPSLLAAPAGRGRQQPQSARAAASSASAHPARSAQRKVQTRSRTGLTVRAAIAEPQRGGLSDVALQTEFRRKRLQTQVADIATNVKTIRSLDWDRERFDIEFGLSNGTTYNSFIIKGADKTALIDSSHEKFRDLYLKALRNEVDLKTLDYIVVSHTEPDHSGLISDLVDLCPNVTVVGCKVCLQFLQAFVHKPMKTLEVKGGSVIDLGGGHQLEFIVAPNLHWPDTMFSFDRGSGILFTCDAFGAHFCNEKVFDEDLTELEPHFRFYYDCLMRPNARSVLTALRKCSDIPYDTVAVGHGPLLRRNVAELVGKYQSWSDDALKKAQAIVSLFYVSDYGFNDRLAQSIARGLTKTDVEVHMVDLNLADTQEIVEAVGRAAALVVTMPPSKGRAHDMLGTVLASVKPKQKLMLAESYGGNDEPVDPLAASFGASGLNLALPALRVKDTPTEATYQEYEESGTDLGQLLTAKKQIEAMKNAMCPEVAKALGRVSGGLYVVTAARGSAKSAMIASWVAQASFEPLGFTVAVAKDRAIESLMQVGDRFALNCLPEGDFQPLMKHFLKRFPPGADRFEGVKWTAASCGAPILLDAVAYVECTVVRRMEANDHWVMYAEVSTGSVQKDGKTASHHRKVASYY